MPNITFQPVLREIRDILKSDYYHIPRFQRPYAWGAENLDEFWSDVVEDNSEGYFIGPMVAFNESRDKYAIVDGQQRITTLTIALCALRDAFLEQGHEELARGLNKYIEREDDESISHFVLTSDGALDFLKTQVQLPKPRTATSPINDDQRAIEKAIGELGSRISESIESIADEVADVSERNEAVATELKRMRDRILSLQVIWIVLDSIDDAYIIFETLNSRGRDLEVVDLLKNFLFKKLPAENGDLDTRNSVWNGMKLTLQESGAGTSANTYLLHWWQSQYRYVSERKLFATMKSDNLGGVSPETFLSNLHSDAVLYARIANPAAWDARREELQVKSSLRALNLFGVKQPRPLILALLRSHSQGIARLKHVRVCFENLEAHHFLTTAIMGTSSTGGVSQMYARHARSISSAKNASQVATILAELYDYLELNRPRVETLVSEFQGLYFTESKSRQKKLVQYVLQKLHDAETGSNPIDPQKCNIEHIFPQSAGSDWVGQIGNLLWIDQGLNSRLGNKPFSDKLAILSPERSRYALDDILSASEWDEKSSLERGERLARLAYDSAWVIQR